MFDFFVRELHINDPPPALYRAHHNNCDTINKEKALEEEEDPKTTVEVSV